MASERLTSFVFFSSLLVLTSAGAPSAAPWPPQFHATLFVNFSGALSTIELWYDWTNGRNLNLIRDQLAPPHDAVYDVEWNNGTSFVYTPAGTCRTVHPGVGILRLDWMEGANYLGRQSVDGFLCNVWEKEKFIWYYEDVVSKRPVHWIFYTGRSVHVMTYEVGAVLEDEKWQAPVYCFENDSKNEEEPQVSVGAVDKALPPEFASLRKFSIYSSSA